MRKLFVYIIAAIILLILTLFEDTDSAAFIITSGLLIGFVIPIVDGLLGESRQLRLLMYTLRTYRSYVRISVSYLFRIKVGDEYLLIRSRRFDHFQPVGGVYKVYPDGKAFLGTIGAQDDNLIPFDRDSSDDLRIRIRGRYLLKFVYWFEKGHGREVGAWREFYEELVLPKMLPVHDFPFIRGQFVRREIQRLRFSERAGSQELLIADIFELVPTADQLLALQKLQAASNADIRWVKEDRIRRRGAAPGVPGEMNIGDHAILTL